MEDPKNNETVLETKPQEEEAIIKTEDKNCQICTTNISKYQCPGCNIKFCSVNCCKKHKEDTKCTGERSKTVYIDLQNFKDSHLLSDYYYLEENKDKVENSNRFRTKNRVYTLETPEPVLFIQKRALSKGVLMTILPEGMSKRKTNTTNYINK